MAKDYDAIIVGASHAGLALACRLQAHGYHVLVLERGVVARKNSAGPTGQSPHAAGFCFDKPMLINFRTLSQLSDWQFCGDQLTAGYEIRRCRITRAGAPGWLNLSHQDSAVECLGRVASMRSWQEAWRKQACAQGVEVRDGAHCSHFERCGDHAGVTVCVGDRTQRLSADLVVAADGSQSSLHRFCPLPARHVYAVRSQILPITFANDTDHTCRQRFMPQGLMAMMPSGSHQGALILSRRVDPLTDQRSAEGCPSGGDDHPRSELDDAIWAAGLAHYGRDLGAIEGDSSAMLSATSCCASRGAGYDDRLLLVGNAALTIPPVTAQGFNLALLDIAHLDKTLTRARADDGVRSLASLLHTSAWHDYLAWRAGVFHRASCRIRFMLPNGWGWRLGSLAFAGAAWSAAVSRDQRHQWIVTFTGEDDKLASLSPGWATSSPERLSK